MFIKLIKYLFAILIVIFVSASSYVLICQYQFNPQVLPEHYGQVDAQLFSDQDKVQPLIVFFGGSEGGNGMAKPQSADERRIYTDNGYAMLSIGYFGMDGTPEHLDRISLNAINDAIQRTQQLQHIDASCVAVIGGSKGAELALSLASKFTNINAAVSLAGPHVSFNSIYFATNGRTGSFAFNNSSLPYVTVPVEAIPALLRGDFRKAHEMALTDQNAVQQARIAVEQINGPVLLISGEKDQVWPSAEMSAQVIERLKQKEFKHPYQHIMVPNGNHFTPQADYHEQVVKFLNTHFISKCQEQSTVKPLATSTNS